MPSRYRKVTAHRPMRPEDTIDVANRLLVEAYQFGRVSISARLLADLVKLAEANVGAEIPTPGKEQGDHDGIR